MCWAPYACSYNALSNRQAWQTLSRSTVLQNPVAQHVYEDVEASNDGQRKVVFVASKLEVLEKTVNSGIANIAPVDEGQQPKTE